MAVETNKREPKSITVSVIKADIGGWVGHSAIHPALLDSAHRQLETAKTSGMLVD
jgi:fructose 1,6-bisphosphate aldolase/phosphatase